MNFQGETLSGLRAKRMAASYDMIGVDYANLRKPDPRIGAMIENALGDARTILNVGAGTGSYEPAGRTVTAVEPSIRMIRQRTLPAASVVQGCAEALPFADDAFDAAMAVNTVHHWADKAAGLAEMRRVTRGPIVLLTFDPMHRGAGYWIISRGSPPSTMHRCRGSRIIGAGSGRWMSSRSPSPMIASTASSMPTGGGRAPISTRRCVPPCRPSMRWVTFPRGWKSCNPISRAAPGRRAMARCSILTPAMWATGW
jgi:SAM-dependent methyltransferase